MKSNQTATIRMGNKFFSLPEGFWFNRYLSKKSFFCLAIGLILTTLHNSCAQVVQKRAPAVFDIGSRRELFVNDYLINTLSGNAELRLHQPVPREIVLKCDEPWEGSGSLYFSIFKDAGIYRMYYRGLDVNSFRKGDKTKKKTDVGNKICYAESSDGIHWKKPVLGIISYNGSKKNNIILAKINYSDYLLDLGDNASFFKDGNPDAAPDARYKAVVCARNPLGLYIFKSADALHWKPIQKKPVLTDGDFDSQNVAFWDSEHKEYRAYWRIFIKGVRSIRTATSKDFVHWENHEDLRYEDSEKYQLYTNQVLPYYRAPYLFIGFPTRYIDRGWSPSMEALPELRYRKIRSSVSAREGTAITETLIMAGTDGVSFKRWREAFLRPGLERPGTWNYGHQYMAWGMVETASQLKGAPPEISLYASEEYKSQRPIGTRLRRYTIRPDGFVSINAPMRGGEVITKPFRFTGQRLWLNFSTSAAGSIRVEIQDEKGRPVPGFSLENCPPFFGDTLQRQVTWQNNTDVSYLQGRVLRLRFVLNDADIYSFQFQ